MSDEYTKFQKYLKQLNSAYFNALSAFYVYVTLKKLKAPNIIGEKKVKENLKTFNRFKNFFVITEHALNSYFLMELAKILDNAKQSLHLNKIINFANSNRKKLSVNEFEKSNLDRNFLQNLINRYENIKKGDLELIATQLKETEGLREKIKKYRDQNLAHNDVKKDEINISHEEVEKMFNLIAKILNTFSYKTDFSTTSYSHVEDDCKRDTKDIIEYLKRFETYRLREVDNRYKSHS